jgi:methylenetetrahydrofolate reductase (NADPH)
MTTKTVTNGPTTFSIEVMPRTAKNIDDFRRILPKRTTVYVAHLEDTPIEEMFFTCKRLISEGMDPMPHIPARIIQNTVELEDWVEEYSSLGVDQSLLLAGNGKTPKGELFNSIQLLESETFEKYAFKKIQIAGHPEGNRDIDKDGSLEKTINALKAKQKFGQNTKLQIGITTQFCFDPQPVIQWLEVLESEQIDLPISLGLAGPTRLQSLIKYAIMCGVGPSISVLKKRAKDLTKLLLPFEPTEMIDALNSSKKNKLFKNVHSLHFFPLGGIEASAAFARNISTPA